MKPTFLKTRHPCLLVPIETKVREYHGKLLFAVHAVRAGYEVVLGDQLELVDCLADFPRSFYLDKSVTVSKEAWFQRLEEMGNVPCAWDEEGLVVRSYDVYKKSRLHPASVERLRCFFTWGDRQRRAVVEAFPGRADVVHATGSPRFDLLRPEWRGVFRAPAEAIRREFGPRILLVNTNHAFANHYKGLDGIRALLDKYPLGSKSDFQRGWFAFQHKNLEVFKRIMPELSRAFPHHHIIVRPSPSENHAMWETFVRPLPNVSMCALGNVHAWICAAEAVVHFNCTTGVEAYLLDKPAIAVRAEENDAYEAELPKALSWHASTPTEVVDLLRDAGRPPLKTDPERRRTASEFMSGLEGPTASDRALDALAKIPPPDGGPRPPLQHLRFKFSDAYAAWRSARSLRVADGYEHQKFPNLEPAEIAGDLAQLAALDGSLEGIGAQRIGRAVYRLGRVGAAG